MELATEQRWMRIGAAAVIGAGILLLLGAHPTTAGLARFFTDLVIWPLDGVETMADREVRIYAAISGVLLTGWGVALWLLAGEGMVRAPVLSRRIILGSVALWFVVDSTGSIMAGVPINLIGNLVFLALLTGPLVLQRDVKPA